MNDDTLGALRAHVGPGGVLGGVRHDGCGIMWNQRQWCHDLASCGSLQFGHLCRWSRDLGAHESELSLEHLLHCGELA